MTVHPAAYNSPMETSECFMLGGIFSYLDILGNIGKSDSPFIVDPIIYTLGIFIDHFSGHALFGCAYTAIKFPVYPE